MQGATLGGIEIVTFVVVHQLRRTMRHGQNRNFRLRLKLQNRLSSVVIR